MAPLPRILSLLWFSDLYLSFILWLKKHKWKIYSRKIWYKPSLSLSLQATLKPTSATPTAGCGWPPRSFSGSCLLHTSQKSWWPSGRGKRRGLRLLRQPPPSSPINSTRRWSWLALCHFVSPSIKGIAHINFTPVMFRCGSWSCPSASSCSPSSLTQCQESRCEAIYWFVYLFIE